MDLEFAENGTWDFADVAKFCKVSVATVKKWRHNRTLTCGRKMGKHVRFEPIEVVEWFRTLPQEVS
jgi:hypothetical protein